MSPISPSPSPTLFDFNGVLVDDEEVHLAAFRETVAHLNIQISDQAYYDRYIGFDDVGAFEALLADHGHDVDAPLIARLVQDKIPHYLKRARQNLPVFVGAAELVRTRAAQGPVGVVSGALRHEIELGLDVLGVRDAVRFIVSAEDTRISKPDPEGYLMGIEKLRAECGHPAPETAWVIEDSVAGIEAAKAAKLRVIAVAHSTSMDVLEWAGADRVKARLADIQAEDFADLKAASGET